MCLCPSGGRASVPLMGPRCPVSVSPAPCWCCDVTGGEAGPPRAAHRPFLGVGAALSLGPPCAGFAPARTGCPLGPLGLQAFSPAGPGVSDRSDRTPSWDARTLAAPLGRQSPPRAPGRAFGAWRQEAALCQGSGTGLFSHGPGARGRSRGCGTLCPFQGTRPDPVPTPPTFGLWW